MTPKNVYKLPANLTFDKQSKRYRYRWPPTDKRTWLGRDQQAAVDQANRLNKHLAFAKHELLKRRVTPSFGDLIDVFIVVRLPDMPLGPGTRKNLMSALNLYKRDLGERTLKSVDRVVIAQWIQSRCDRGSAMRKHRLNFVRLYDYAISRKWCNFNEAAAIQKFSGSLKLETNKVLRKRLSIDEFWQIHDHAPLHIQVAMQQSLVTLQARTEVCNMLHEHYKDGYLYVVRKKTAGESDAAFIKIKLSAEMQRIAALSRSSGIASPLLVHRLWVRGSKPAKADIHPTFVRPQQLSVSFAKARVKSGVGTDYERGEAPSFHEIRSLGARLMAEQGINRQEIQRLLAHGNQRTSAIYLDGRDDISTTDYIPVEATLIIKR